MVDVQDFDGLVGDAIKDHIRIAAERKGANVRRSATRRGLSGRREM